MPVILNPLENLPNDFDRLGARFDNAKILHEAGVRVAFSYFETFQARKNRQLAGNAVAHGLPWDAALAAITSNPAEIFGIGADHGRIEKRPGRRSRALERRPARGDDRRRAGLDRRQPGHHALEADGAARSVPGAREGRQRRGNVGELTIYHNPKCSKSRETLALLEGRGVSPCIVEYLKTPPTAAELETILRKLGLGPSNSSARAKTPTGRSTPAAP